eukprot:6183998-Pleurochrysis_carterae.AAC.1
MKCKSKKSHTTNRFVKASASTFACLEFEKGRIDFDHLDKLVHAAVRELVSYTHASALIVHVSIMRSADAARMNTSWTSRAGTRTYILRLAIETQLSPGLLPSKAGSVAGRVACSTSQ